MRFLIVRIIVPLLLLLLVRSLLRSLFAGFRSSTQSAPRREAPPAVPTGGELRRDPVCGTCGSTVSCLTRTGKGQLVYFCSKECRDKYRIA